MHLSLSKVAYIPKKQSSSWVHLKAIFSMFDKRVRKIMQITCTQKAEHK